MGPTGMARSMPAAEKFGSLTIQPSRPSASSRLSGGHAYREEAQTPLVPGFPTPQLLMRAALPALSQGSLYSTPPFLAGRRGKTVEQEALRKVWAWGPILSGLRAPHLDEVQTMCRQTAFVFVGSFKFP